MPGRLQGKVALITGAARGQGRSHAVALAREGADIIAVDVCSQIASVPYPMSTEADLAETARLVEELDRRIVARVADVRERGALAAVVEAGVAELGRLDIVVANAGIISMGKGIPPTAFLDTVSVDLVGVINTVEIAFPHLGAGASVICIGSMAAMIPGSQTGSPGTAGYSYAKRAVARFVHDLALAAAPSGIRVNAVHPGNIDTDMLQNETMYRQFRPDLEHPTREDAQAAFGSMHALPVNTLDPADISEAVLYLASDAARYVTGQQLKVDAGALLTYTSSGAPADSPEGPLCPAPSAPACCGPRRPPDDFPAGRPSVTISKTVHPRTAAPRGGHRTVEFSAELQQDGKTATGVTVPEEVLAALGSGRRPAVAVTINGHTFRTTIGSIRGVAKIPVSAAVRAAAGVTAGDLLVVEVAADATPREVSVPDDLTAALDGDQAAAGFFAGLSYSHKNAYVTWIEEAKKPETRARRVAETAARLAAKQAQR